MLLRTLLHWALIGFTSVVWTFVGPAAHADEAGETVAQRDPRSESRAFFARIKEEAPVYYYLGTQRHDQAIALFSSIEEIDAIDPTTGTTLLTLAARGDRSDAYDAVRILILKYGADVTRPDQTGLTALHFAASVGNLAVVELLLKYGADIHAAPLAERDCVVNCEKSEKTPLYMAYLGGHPRVRDFLISRGARMPHADLVRELEFASKRIELARKFRGSPPRNLDQSSLEDWYRERISAQFNELDKLLRADGRIAEANRLPAEFEPLIQAIMETPREPGMKPSEWSTLVKEKMVRNIVRNETKGDLK